MKAKTVIITGAAGSLGSALTHRYAESGATVVMLDRDTRGLNRVYDSVMEKGLEEPVIHPLDLSAAGPDDAALMMNSISSELGGLHSLIHCAARFEGLTPLEQFDPEEWLLQIQINLNSAWLLSSQALPLLRESGDGQLVFMLENLDRVCKANWGAYGVSKLALSAMVRQWAMETGSSGVAVLGINPGPFQSGLRSEAYLSEDPSTQHAPETVANAVHDLLETSGVASDPYVELFSS